jgi:hypothetical protein
LETSQLTYRLYEEKDLPGIISIWEKESGWGGITEQQFYDWYINTPYGRCIIIVATDSSNEIVGQTVFTPTRIYLDQKELKAFRISAPILNAQIRKVSLKQYDHPAFGMMRYGTKVAIESGFSIGYVLPAVGWISLLKLLPSFGLPYKLVPYECFGVSLTDISTYVNPGNGIDISVSIIKKFTPEYDSLWNDAVTTLPVECGIVRKSKWLQYKLGGHIVFEVRKSNQLFGYVAVKNSGLLVDIFAKSIADIRICLNAVLRSIHHSNPEKIQTEWKDLKGMFTPTAKLFLSEVKYEMINFQFAFGYCPLDERISPDNLDPKRWFIMPDD